MTDILMWAGIGLIVIGWLALGWQASRRLAIKAELEKFPEKKHAMQLRRNYCWLIMGAGMCLLVIALAL